MADIFHEVEEQLRSERYKTLALQVLPWVGGALVLALVLALGVWGFDSYRAKVDARASEAYAAGLETLQAGDKVRAFGQFEAAAKAGSKPYRALALMQQGGLRLDERKIAEAVALFDEAAKAAPDAVIGDAARLQAAYALMDTANATEVEGRLKIIAADGRPYRLQGIEGLAMSRLAHGQTAAAREDLTVLITGLDTPPAMRERAQAAQALIDSGSAARLPNLLKTARELPDSALLPPQASPPNAQAGTGQ